MNNAKDNINRPDREASLAHTYILDFGNLFSGISQRVIDQTRKEMQRLRTKQGSIISQQRAIDEGALVEVTAEMIEGKNERILFTYHLHSAISNRYRDQSPEARRHIWKQGMYKMFLASMEIKATKRQLELPFVFVPEVDGWDDGELWIRREGGLYSTGPYIGPTVTTYMFPND